MARLTAEQPASTRNIVTDFLMLLELKSDPTADKRPVSTLTFDWIYTLFALLLTLGLWLDIWSHSVYGPDQGVFNEFHMLFYGSMVTMAGLLLFMHFKSLKQGIAWRHSLPKGYGMAAFGVMIFGGSGAFDLVGHAMFGFETGMEALFSPSHIGLFMGWFIIGSGAFNAAMARRNDETLSLIQILPMMIGAASMLSCLTTVILHFGVLGDDHYATQLFREGRELMGHLLVVPGLYVQTALISTMILWLAGKFRLPFGAFTLLYFLYMGFMFIFSRDTYSIVIMLIAGLLTDILFRLLRPNIENKVTFRVFGFVAPFIMWTVYYSFFIITGINGGVWFTPYVWMGTIFHAGVIGFFAALLMTTERSASTIKGKNS
jgi:hypothetical protein